MAEWYKRFKKGPNGDKFDIVFVSSDRDEKSWKEYFAEMPWKALDFSDRDKKVRHITSTGGTHLSLSFTPRVYNILLFTHIPTHWRKNQGALPLWFLDCYIICTQARGWGSHSCMGVCTVPFHL